MQDKGYWLEEKRECTKKLKDILALVSLNPLIKDKEYTPISKGIEQALKYLERVGE